MLKDIAEFNAQAGLGELSSHQAMAVVDHMLEGLPKTGRIFLTSPDITRYYPYGGAIASYLYHRPSRETKVRIVPAVEAHRTTSREEQIRFSGEDVSEGVPLCHDWREDAVPVGTVSDAYYGQISGGRYTSDIDTEIDRYVVGGSFDLVLSIDQVVPRGVIGMSNYTKDVLVGLGGRPMINGTYILDAFCNLEIIVGNTDTPVRAVFDYEEECSLRDVSLVYILIVLSEQEGRTTLYGIFTGTSRWVYEHVAMLAKGCCITQVERRTREVMAYLEPEEFSTIWMRNKAIYRTRTVTEDGGGLFVTAPRVEGPDESPEVDGLTRHYGYRGAPYIMELVENGAFPGSVVVPAHIIHGSPEGRLTITYTVNPEYMSQNEMDRIRYEFMGMRDALARYPILEMKDG